VYFSMRKPTAELRQGARPPAVRMATFAYGMHSFGSFCARGGVGYRVCGRCAARPRRRRGRPRWPRSGGASAGLPPYLCKLHAPPVPRAHGCQQRWNGQRDGASGAVGVQRPRKPRISATCKTPRPLSPTAARTAEACRAVIAGSNRYSPASAACGIQSWLLMSPYSFCRLKVKQAFHRGSFRRS